jgi:hypothetical protein
VQKASYVRLGRLHCIASALCCIDKERLRTTTDMEISGLSGMHYEERNNKYLLYPSDESFSKWCVTCAAESGTGGSGMPHQVLGTFNLANVGDCSNTTACKNDLRFNLRSVGDAQAS